MEDVICMHRPQISDSKGFEMQAPFRERSLHTLSSGAHARTTYFVQFDSHFKLNLINIFQLQRRGADLRVRVFLHVEIKAFYGNLIIYLNKCQISRGGSSIPGELIKSIAATFVLTSVTLPLNSFQAAAPNGPSL